MIYSSNVWDGGNRVDKKTGETLRVETGDQILDLKKLAECEECYDQFQQKSAENKEKTLSLSLKIGQ